MDLITLRAFFGWCTLLNWAVLAAWLLMLLFASDFVYRLHGRMFGLETAKLRAIHYKCLAYYKLGTLLFNLAPYVALRIVG